MQASGCGRHWSLNIVLAASALLVFSPLRAEQASPSAAVDASACLSCHGQAGSELAPLLEGQHAAYLQVQIARFRDHVRQSFPMDALTQGLDDKAIAQLSANLAARPWSGVAPARRASSQDSELASDVDLQSCVSCHGERLMGAETVPRLAGQRSTYIVQQLEAIAEQRRQHPDLGRGVAWGRREMRAMAAAIEAR